jgi:hypothetical protein
MIDHIYNQEKFGEDWFNFKELYKFFVDSHHDESHFVEVGSWKGKSAAFMAVEIINSQKNIKFDCVDTWFGSVEHKDYLCVKNKELYDIFISNTKELNHIINPIRLPSIEAAKQYKDKSIDVVFIDACHEYKCVIEDIDAWLPKVKNGGILAGHDIHHPDVLNAVKEKLPGFYSRDECWVFEKK